jgi:hypothetical protein
MNIMWRQNSPKPRNCSLRDGAATYLRPTHKHGFARRASLTTADSAVESVVGFTPGSTRMRAPLTSISITPLSWPGGDAISGSFVCADVRRPGSLTVAGPPSEAIRTGTKPAALTPPPPRPFVATP